MSIEARIVTASVTRRGKVTKIDDETFHINYAVGDTAVKVNNAWRPDTNLDAALKEEHYGWTLKPDVDQGCDINFVLPEQIDVCTNDKDDATHLNTVRALPPELVKLDCGYWGNYYRNKPQRNFGVVQGYDVWLCNFTDHPFKNTQDIPDPGTPFARLLDKLASCGVGVEFKLHTVAMSSPISTGIDDNLLYIFLPDLHLPERWPDPPPASARHPNPAARKALRVELRQAQRDAGWLSSNPMDGARQSFIQAFLEGVYIGEKTKLTVANPGGTPHVFTPGEVSAEKDVLDRTIRSRSTWFYPPVSGNSETGAPEDKDDLAQADPAPAMDLAMFLAGVKLTKAEGATIKVVQLGDLYELWMGREFLYRNFPSLSIYGLGATAFAILQSVTSETLGINDNLQYRMGVDWRDESVAGSVKSKVKGWLGIDFAHPIPRYVFHSWFQGYVIRRYRTGWNYSNGSRSDTQALQKDGINDILSRLLKLLNERVTAVKRFCLPLPTPASTSLQTLHAMLKLVGRPLTGYKDHGEQESDSYGWNHLIFDLLQDCGFENIHGNHDGYRSDPLFRPAVGIFSEEWKSFDGIWAEHGHRWDEYNRDGVAFGAGMTNLVYYYNQELIELSKSSLITQVFPQEQKSFIPGAAQWYILVNVARNPYVSRDKSKRVKPFGIYVAGHTHSPDLCRIRFDFDS